MARHAHAYENTPKRQAESQACRWDPRLLAGTAQFGCPRGVGVVVKAERNKDLRFAWLTEPEEQRL